MNDDRAQLLKELFQSAAELAGDDRAGFLAAHCRDDASLRMEIDTLLAADGRVRERFLEGPPRAADEPALPERIGRYAIVRRIGAGGMGTVFEAVQENPRRSIALKLLNYNLLSSESLRRFEYESQVLAKLLHPGIAQVYEVGTEQLGGVRLPFFVMELIPDARPITDYARTTALDVRQRLVLFSQACDAVQHGHQKGVIHRDLKPSNIVVDSAGRARVIDFGVARSVGRDAAASNQTSAGRVIGTLPYMSPEQCSGEQHDLDVRSDIYSLGVVLYELLCDRLPYDVGSGSVLEAARVIREQAPAWPSAVQRALRGDLQTIVLRVLDKDRTRRYQTAGDLARDIRHYLEGEPIEARRDSTFYVLRTTLRRYRTLLAVLMAFLVLISGSTVVAWTLMVRTARSEQLARDRLVQAEYESYVANIAAAGAAIAAQDGGAALKRLQSTPEALRNWEWRYLLRQADQSVATWQGPKDLITGRVRLSPDHRHVAASFWMEDRAGALRVWPRTSRDPVAELTFATGHVAPFEFLSDGQELLACDRDGTLLRFDLAERGETDPPALPALPDGETVLDFWAAKHLLLTCRQGTYFLRDTVGGRLSHALTLPYPWISRCALDATGRRLALGLGDGVVMVLDVVSGNFLAETRAHAGMVFGTAFSPNGGLLATAGEVGELKLWDVSQAVASPNVAGASGPAPPLSLVREFHCGAQRVGIITFSPDGELLAAPSEDKTVRIWSVADGELRTTLLGHTTGVVCTDFASDGRWLLSGVRDGVVKLWDLQQSPPVRAFSDLPIRPDSIAFTPDGGRLRLHGRLADYLTVCVMDIASGTRLHEHRMSPATTIGDILARPDGLQTAFNEQAGGVYLSGIGADGQFRKIGAHNSQPQLAGDASSQLLASADADAVVLWSWLDGHELRRFPGPGEAVGCLALSPDAARLALGLDSGELIVQDARTGHSRRLAAHSRKIASAAFSPDGRRLATGSDDGTVKLWNAASGDVLWSAAPQLGDVWCVAFSADGKRVAVGGRDRSVRLLDSENGQELLALRGPTGTVISLALSPDGERIAAGSHAGEVFIWDADSPAAEEQLDSRAAHDR